MTIKSLDYCIVMDFFSYLLRMLALLVLINCTTSAYNVFRYQYLLIYFLCCPVLSMPRSPCVNRFCSDTGLSL